MLTESGQRVVKTICQRIPLQPWEMDVDTHYKCIQDYLGRELARAFPACKPQRAKSFLSGATWVVRDHRTWLRKQTAVLRIRAKHIGELASLCACRGGKSLAAMWCRMLLMLRGEAKEKADFVRQLRDTRKDLKQSLRKDRQKWLSELAQQASDMSVKDVVCRLHSWFLEDTECGPDLYHMAGDSWEKGLNI